MLKNAQRAPQKQTRAFFFCQRGDKTRTMRDYNRTKQINTAAISRIMDKHRHTCDHKASYHTNSVWLTSWGGGKECVVCCACACVCSPLDRVSLMTQSPAFSAQNSVSSAFTKERAIRSKPPGPTQRLQCSTQRDNASIFKCFIYMPTHFLILGWRFSQNQAFFLDFCYNFYQRCLN